ncbi:MAG TPA: sodium:solute symporter, partial [Chryseobacterium sp.]|nr:sodium:solute symporter [Chryseobacterium sp.]
YVLLPLYYRLQLTSIYGYLQHRMGHLSYKSGAWIFIVSRLVGATARLYLVVNILQVAILDSLGVPFIVTTLVILAMIILYTYEGGVKTIVWTDTLQTTCMLLGLIICSVYMMNHLGLDFMESISEMNRLGYTEVFNTDVNSKAFFFKQVLAGAFITITMTGIDQEMMQKSLSVTKLKDSQKNMVTLGFILVGVIALFLFMGGLLHLYGNTEHVVSSGDQLFPDIALNHMPPVISIIFIIALISALFPSADGAMTALTSSLCIDIFGLKDKHMAATDKEKFRKRVHLIVAVAFLVMVIIFKLINDNSMIGLILKMAGFTYGPLLGLFAFGIFTKLKVQDRLVPYVCVAAPVVSYLIDKYQENIFGDFKIGLELLIINGLLTFAGLWLIRRK